MAEQNKDDPVAAAKAALDAPELNDNAAMTIAASAAAVGWPAALIVAEVQYTCMPELGDGVFIDEEGEELDMKLPAARRALLSWRKTQVELAALQTAGEEAGKAGPDDLHLFHVEHPEDMISFEGGRRWCHVSDLSPGMRGNEGVLVHHGVVIEYVDPDSKERFQLQFRVSHVMDDVVSLEPGNRVRGDGVVFYPKGHVLDWLQDVAAAEQMTVDRWVSRLVHQQGYAISDYRVAGHAGTGDGSLVAGKAGAMSGVQADIEAGRAARAAG